MIIKKQPVFAEITCTKCGTVFIPEADDEILCTGIDKDGKSTLEIDCPTCRTFYQCNILGYYKYEKD